MESLGLSLEDLHPTGPLNSRRALARAQSAQIMSKKFLQRDRVKQEMKAEEARLKQQKKAAQKRQQAKWQQKMTQSPFTVNLVAESERLEEEHAVRLVDEAARQKDIERRQLASRQEIILRALQEESDLEALRREKRAIIEEERRLKALLDLEKTNGHGKQDHLAAQRAEKMRHQTKKDYRRSENIAAIEDMREKEKDLLIMKHDIPLAAPNTFGGYGTDSDAKVVNETYGQDGAPTFSKNSGER